MEETFKNEQEASRYEYKIERTDAKIMKLTSKLEELEGTLQATVASILNTKDDIKAMEDARKEQHAAFESAKSDDEGAVKLLAAAIESMTAFYKNNKIGMGEIQGAAQALQKGPVFEVSADQAPDASFSGAGKSSGESKGIISTLTMIKEDLDDEIKNGVKQEEEDQVEFEEKLKQDLIDTKTNLEEAISNTNDEIDAHQETKADRQADLNAEHEYLWSIKPDCTWMLNTFDDRRKKRDVEVDGLRQSIALLEGSMEEANAAGEPIALTQQRKVFDDDAFGRLSFKN